MTCGHKYVQHAQIDDPAFLPCDLPCKGNCCDAGRQSPTPPEQCAALHGNAPSCNMLPQAMPAAEHCPHVVFETAFQPGLWLEPCQPSSTPVPPCAPAAGQVVCTAATAAQAAASAALLDNAAAPTLATVEGMAAGSAAAPGSSAEAQQVMPDVPTAGTTELPDSSLPAPAACSVSEAADTRNPDAAASPQTAALKDAPATACGPGPEPSAPDAAAAQGAACLVPPVPAGVTSAFREPDTAATVAAADRCAPSATLSDKAAAAAATGALPPPVHARPTASFLGSAGQCSTDDSETDYAAVDMAIAAALAQSRARASSAYLGSRPAGLTEHGVAGAAAHAGGCEAVRPPSIIARPIGHSAHSLASGALQPPAATAHANVPGPSTVALHWPAHALPVHPPTEFDLGPTAVTAAPTAAQQHALHQAEDNGFDYFLTLPSQGGGGSHVAASTGQAQSKGGLAGCSSRWDQPPYQPPSHQQHGSMAPPSSRHQQGHQLHMLQHQPHHQQPEVWQQHQQQQHYAEPPLHDQHQWQQQQHQHQHQQWQAWQAHPQQHQHHQLWRQHQPWGQQHAQGVPHTGQEAPHASKHTGGPYQQHGQQQDWGQHHHHHHWHQQNQHHYQQAQSAGYAPWSEQHPQQPGHAAAPVGGWPTAPHPSHAPIPVAVGHMQGAEHHQQGQAIHAPHAGLQQPRSHHAPLHDLPLNASANGGRTLVDKPSAAQATSAHPGFPSATAAFVHTTARAGGDQNTPCAPPPTAAVGVGGNGQQQASRDAADRIKLKSATGAVHTLPAKAAGLAQELLAILHGSGAGPDASGASKPSGPPTFTRLTKPDKSLHSSYRLPSAARQVEALAVEGAGARQGRGAGGQADAEAQAGIVGPAAAAVPAPAPARPSASAAQGAGPVAAAGRPSGAAAAAQGITSGPAVGDSVILRSVSGMTHAVPAKAAGLAQELLAILNGSGSDDRPGNAKPAGPPTFTRLARPDRPLHSTYHLPSAAKAGDVASAGPQDANQQRPGVIVNEAAAAAATPQVAVTPADADRRAAATAAAAEAPKTALAGGLTGAGTDTDGQQAPSAAPQATSAAATGSSKGGKGGVTGSGIIKLQSASGAVHAVPAKAAGLAKELLAILNGSGLEEGAGGLARPPGPPTFTRLQKPDKPLHSSYRLPSALEQAIPNPLQAAEHGDSPAGMHAAAGGATAHGAAASCQVGQAARPGEPGVACDQTGGGTLADALLGSVLQPPAAGLFTSAAGRQVHISEAALAKAGALFSKADSQEGDGDAARSEPSAEEQQQPKRRRRQRSGSGTKDVHFTLPASAVGDAKGQVMTAATNRASNSSIPGKS